MARNYLKNLMPCLYQCDTFIATSHTDCGFAGPANSGYMQAAFGQCGVAQGHDRVQTEQARAARKTVFSVSDDRESTRQAYLYRAVSYYPLSNAVFLPRSRLESSGITIAEALRRQMDVGLVF